MPLPDLDLLVAVLDCGSLTAAADHLGMPRATVSRRLARLEEDMGVRLVQRTTRQLSATAPGEELYRHARPIVQAVESAVASVRAIDGEPRGLLRITLPPGGEAFFGELVPSFLARHPEVRIEVLSVTRHVDLVAEGFDLGVRGGELQGSSLVSRRLGGGKRLAVASPDYLARRGTPTSPDELVDHDCLVGFARGEIPRRTWATRGGRHVPVSARFACNDLHLLARAARMGTGIAMLPEQFLGDSLRTGELVQVLPEHFSFDGSIWVVYPEKRLMLPRVRAFIDHLVEWSKTSILALSESGGPVSR